MPTYTNNTGFACLGILNTSGNRVTVENGSSVMSFERLERTHGFTLTSEYPYLDNFFLAHVFSGAGSWEYNLTTDQFDRCSEAIILGTGSGFACAVRVNAAAAPVIGNIAVDDGIIQVGFPLEKRVNSIIVTATAAGTVNLYLQ